MPSITKTEFKRRLLAELIVWPPIIYDGRIWGWSIESEDRPREFVWATL